MKIERNQVNTQRKNARQSQIGTAARSEKIRTYNFQQGRVTDHRLGESVHDLEGFMNAEYLDRFIDALIIQDENEKLSSLK